MTPRTTCPVCDNEVEGPRFCGHCAATLADPAATAGRGLVGRLTAPLRRLVPVDTRPRAAGPYRLILLAGLLIALIALLVGAAGIAIAAASAIVPAMTVRYLTDIDVFEGEPALALLAAAGGGLLAGLLISPLNAWLTGELWFNDGVLNIGSAGFGGDFAAAAGAPPIAFLIIQGVFVPILAAALMLAGPMLLRRWRVFRNEVMDGLTLGAAAGAAFGVGNVIVYYFPLIQGDNPGGNVATWSTTLLGVALIRPLILTATTALIGAGIWRFGLSGQHSALVMPIAAGLGGAIIYTVGSLLVQPSGLRLELLWHAAVLLGLTVICRMVLRGALTFDRRALGKRGARIVCPTCGHVTPAGEFCSNCGKALPPVETTTEPVRRPDAEVQATAQPATTVDEAEPWTPGEPTPAPTSHEPPDAEADQPARADTDWRRDSS